MKIKPVLCLAGVPMDGRLNKNGLRMPFAEILNFDHRTRRALVNWEGSLVVVETKPNPRVDALLDVIADRDGAE